MAYTNAKRLKLQKNKETAFLNFAKDKKWDASLCFYNGKFIAMLNPVDNKKVFEGESELSIDKAIDECKADFIKSKGRK